MIQVQLVSALVLHPKFPYEGQNITVNIPIHCPYYDSINAQGLRYLLEFNHPNLISLYVVYGSWSGCPGVRPPPSPAYYELGPLSEGVYTLQFFQTSENDILPIQNGTPDYSFEFQVRGAPADVNTLSGMAFLLLVVGFILATLGVMKFRTR